jgi:hypothetical protein
LTDALRCGAEERKILPRHFGRHMLSVENAVYAWKGGAHSLVQRRDVVTMCGIRASRKFA